MRKLTLEEIQDIADIILFGTKNDIDALVKNPETPILKLWLAGLIQEALDKKSITSLQILDSFLDRLIGKTPTQTKLDVSDNIHTTLVGLIKKFENEP